MQKQQPQPQRERQNHADGDVAVRALAEDADADSGEDGEEGEAEERRQADEDGASGAGKADVAERMAGEGLAAQHQKVADGAGDQAHHRAGGIGVAHELIGERVHTRRLRMRPLSSRGPPISASSAATKIRPLCRETWIGVR